jgi:hypothetical protein
MPHGAAAWREPEKNFPCYEIETTGRSNPLQTIEYYRREAAHARRMASNVNQVNIAQTLNKVAQDYEDIAVDLETGAVEIRHPESMPQNRSSEAL